MGGGGALELRDVFGGNPVGWFSKIILTSKFKGREGKD